MKNPLYLLDGYSLIYRSYFAFIRNPLFNPEGKNRSAVFGFFRTLFSFFQSKKPEAFAVILDSITPTFRHELYLEYKATREKTPEELHDQIPVIEEICSILGFPMIRKNGYEADDIIASYSKKCLQEGVPCCIITGDKDLLQLVEGEVKILRPDKGDYLLIGREEVKESWGVWPEQIGDYLSLTGDQADNIPGVRGIGPKTAEKLLNQYKTLEGVYENLEKITGSEKNKLEQGRESAFLSRRLVELKGNLSELPPLGELRIETLNCEAAAALFLREGAKSLAELVKQLRPLYPAEASVKRSGETVPRVARETAELQGELFPESGESTSLSAPGRYETVSSIKGLEDWIERIRKSKTFAFDVETDSLDELKANPVGFSLSVKEGEGCYIPLVAEGVKVLEEEAVREKLRLLLCDPELSLVGQNIKYDYKVVRRWGIRITNITFDTMIAAWLLDTQGSTYNLDKLAEIYLNYKTLHYDEVVPKGSNFRDVPVDLATRYSGEDADITFRLYKLFLKKLKTGNLFKLFTEIEIPLIPILAEMELKGIILKPERLYQYGKELAETLEEINREIYKLCGKEFNINSTKQLQEVLFVDRKLSPTKKTKTGFSTDLQVLEELALEDRVPELVLRHRSLSKLKSTYVDSLPQLINQETGRIHSRFIQTGTATGRLSSRDPNLQNIPIREEEGRRIRSAFVPAPGHVFISADYSQIELVVLAHLSGDPGLIEAFKSGHDIHKQTASTIFETPLDSITPDQRRIAKTINFGIMYGMSAFRLSRELKIPRAQADRFIESYFTKFRGINHYIQQVIQEAEKTGKVSTLFGRERNVPGIRSRNKTEKMGAERIAVNTGIQGSAADIVKIAMINISQKIEKKGYTSRLILQVHDELVFEVPLSEEKELSALVKGEMEAAVTLSVPLRVSLERGESWGAMH